jgi:hypothetical protein
MSIKNADDHRATDQREANACADSLARHSYPFMDQTNPLSVRTSGDVIWTGRPEPWAPDSNPRRAPDPLWPHLPVELKVEHPA